MSAKILVVYHARVFGGEPPVTEGHTLDVLVEQMQTLRECGLLEACDKFLFCLNGDSADGWALRNIAPDIPGKTELWINGRWANSELPTLARLQRLLPEFAGWRICYFHLKGARHGADDPLTMAWRRCMEGVVLWKWRECARALELGYESAGAHWLTNAQYGSLVKRGFWGGNFWWAQAEFLQSLPILKVNRTCREDDFLAETWIGDGPRLPKVLDLRPHWPNLERCGAP